MKRFIFLVPLTLLLVVSACSTPVHTADGEPVSPAAVVNAVNAVCDVDLTVMGSNMVYAEVFCMVTEPEKYIGKTVKMAGTFAVSEGEGRMYYACLIADAAACCPQGMAFVLTGEPAYPDGYPPLGSAITVTGRFDTYTEGDQVYCQLIDAELTT